jgi:lysophospholipase L1-like esterase
MQASETFSPHQKIVGFSAVLLFLCLLYAQRSQSQNPCLKAQSFHVVVLGSSTAAGVGPSTGDSSWVSRYRRYLQTINQQNQVTNLAVGGYTTYRIMPDSFASLPNRPQPNPNRNISEAIRRQADAIIVNMPSNDVANNYTVAEQLSNFRDIAATADSAGIPIWICTVQPRTFSTSQWQTQLAVRDSINQIFGAQAIDFWTGLPNNTNGILPAFDSGDGVHLNDAGHKLLADRMVAKNIPGQLVDTLAQPDVFAFGLSRAGGACASAQDTFLIHISNKGTLVNYPLPIQWHLQQNGVNQVFNDTLYGGVAPCSDTVLKANFNTALGGAFNLRVFLQTQQDSILQNDTVNLTFTVKSLPTISAQGDSVCRGEKATLFASGGDTIRWYDAQGNWISSGDSLILDSLTQNTVFYAEAATGPFYHTASLSTITNTNVNWRGIMFSLVASDTAVVDSLSLKVQSAGTYNLNAYYLNGDYQGLEASPSAWTFWGSDSVQTFQNDSFTNALFGPLSIPAGDTLSIYLQMPAGSNLQYSNQGQARTFSDTVLSLIGGTGVAGQFGTTYFPRIFSGGIYYHYGSKPEGQCQKDTMVEAVVRRPKLNVLPDTLYLNLGDLVPFQIPGGYSQVRWSNGGSGSSFVLNANNYRIGRWQTLRVAANNRFGCIAEDSLKFIIYDPLQIIHPKKPAFKLYPNPNFGSFWLELPAATPGMLAIYNTTGQKVWQKEVVPKQKLNLNLAPGVYFLKSRSAAGEVISFKVLQP